MIKEKLRRELTIYSGKRGYGKTGDSYDNTDIIFTVITRLEISRLTGEIGKIDPMHLLSCKALRILVVEW